MLSAHTCTSCGLIQQVQDANQRKARCVRCDFRLNHPASAGPVEATLWVLLLLALLSVSIHDTFMGFTYAGGTHSINVSQGPLEVIRLGSTVVGLAVLFCAVISPLVWGLGMLYVVGGLAARAPGPGTARVLRAMNHLRPWVMLEIFLLGVVVTAGKLGHDGQISYGRGFYLYLAAFAVWIVIGRRVQNARLWEALRPAPTTPAEPTPAAALLGCQTCGFVQHAVPLTDRQELACSRCGAPLDEVPRAALTRCVTLLIIAALLLLPANLVPIMRIAQLGPPEPATVWEGIKVLYFGGSPGLAILVFGASLCVPILKVLLLALLVAWRNPRRCATARRLAKLHRLIATIGRWSMVDMFVVALLIGLVRLGALASVDPKPGAIAFLAAVLVTIAAAEALNPKMFWTRTETHRNDD